MGGDMSTRGKLPRTGWGAALVTAALIAGTAAPAGAHTAAPAPIPAPAGTVAGADHGGLPDRALRAALQQVTEAGAPGIFAEVRDGRGVWRGASGVADVTTGRPMRPGFQQRVGSITKTFVATTLLQLVGERRLVLDAPIGRYLPEYAVDGVTVRMLLDHTSGIGDYDTVLFPTGEAVERGRYTTYDPRELVRIGMAEPRTGAPGALFSYSNTNYILAGLILERVTGRPATQEITRRILRPLGLRGTYFPGTATRIAGPHAAAYIPWYDGSLRDFSDYNMSWGWTAGELISTTADLDRFYRALLGGRLLRPAELAQMRTTVPFTPANPAAGGYGLALYWLPLPCGPAWGHDGLVFGHGTISWHSPDGGRQATIAMNLTHYQIPGRPDPIGEAAHTFMVTALCGPDGATAPGARTAVPDGHPADSRNERLFAPR
jgi:D-alanyl-D-alanine carboxypeptidase